MQVRVGNRRRLYAGLVLVAFGALGVFFAAGLRFGSAAAMGPGFLPTICSWLVVVLGILVLAQALREGLEVLDPMVPRPVAMIFLSIGVFALLIERAGLGLTAFLTAFLASYAGQEARLVETLVLAAIVAVGTVVVFVVLLGLSIPVWPGLG